MDSIISLLHAAFANVTYTVRFILIKQNIETNQSNDPKGIILTGGPNSCYEADSPTYTKELFELGIPVLGLCYGAQLMMHILGGKVEAAPVREYGKTEVFVDKKDSKIFADVSEKTICMDESLWLYFQSSSGIYHQRPYSGLSGSSRRERRQRLIRNPVSSEVLHTVEGTKMLSNFVLNVCGCAGDWKMDAFVENTVKRNSWKSRRWTSITRSLRRSRLIRSSRIIIQSHRQAVNLCIRRPWSSP